MVKKLLKDLNDRSYATSIFSNVRVNPIGSNVTEGVGIFQKGNHDGVIAFGGGSGLDVGKAVAFMSGQSRPIWDFEDVGNYWTRANPDGIVPIIAVPTTAGTGSETGRASVIVNEKTGVKKIIFHPKILPSIVILDPVLTVNLIPKLTAATGMDALAHNLEAFCAPGFHPMADGIALEGMYLIKKWLIVAFNDGKNLEARSNMLVAASMGSTAFQKGLGAIHSLSHPVNSVYNVHHGLSNAIFMPYVLTFNKKEIEKKIIKISRYLDFKEETFSSFLNWIIALRKELNIPHKLSDVVNVKKEDLNKLSSMALEDPSTSGNPKRLELNDLKTMYQHSIEGKLFN
jgi:alcohol dehydrogenase